MRIVAAYMTQTMKVDGQDVVLEIWDTAGQERYNSLLPMYYRGSHAALVVYDVTNPDSFKRAATWVKELQVWFHMASVVAWLTGMDLCSALACDYSQSMINASEGDPRS